MCIIGRLRWPNRRTGGLAFLLFAAVLLPLLVNLFLQAAFSAGMDRSHFESTALERSRHLTTSIEAQLERTRGAAAALVTNKSIRARDWPSAYARAKEIAEQNPDWEAVILWDRQTRREIFDTSHPLKLGQRLRPLGSPAPLPSEPSELVLSNIEPAGDGCPCLYAHAAAGSGLPLILTVRLHSDSFQQIVAREGAGLLAAYLVDRRGGIIAQAFDSPAARATILPRQAREVMSKKASSSYRTPTGDHKNTYVAYDRSHWTGWSTHLVFPSAAVDRAQFRRIGAWALAAAASLAIAVLLTLMILRNFKVQSELDSQTLQAVKAEAAEQNSVARDLHDGILQFLTGADLHIESAKRNIKEGAAAVPIRKLEELQHEIRHEQRDLRRFIESLSPEFASNKLGSILDLRAALARRWGVEVLLLPLNVEDMVPDNLRRDIELILREAVSNSVRHGGATKIVISLASRFDKTVITIADNGSEARSVKGGEGIVVERRGTIRPASILGRVASHGGHMNVKETAEGTTLDIEFPEA